MFQPDQEILERIIDYLGSLASNSSFRTQALAQSKLKALHESLQSYSCYLSLIMIQSDLKDNIRNNACIYLTSLLYPEATIVDIDFMKRNMLIAFRDPLFEKSIIRLISSILKI
jgi:hypothetical protein